LQARHPLLEALRISKRFQAGGVIGYHLGNGVGIAIRGEQGLVEMAVQQTAIDPFRLIEFGDSLLPGFSFRVTDDPPERWLDTSNGWAGRSK
jgi:hypothetical protein